MENKDKGRGDMILMMLCFPLKKIRKLSEHSSFLFLVFLNREVHVSEPELIDVSGCFFFPVQTVFHFSSPSVLMTVVIHLSARSHSPFAFMSKNKESPVTPFWPRPGFLIDPDNTDNTIHKWRDTHSFRSTHGLSFSSVSNCTTHKQAGFSFIQITALRHAPIHFQPLRMVFAHLADPPPACQLVCLPAGSDCDLGP